jgi:hypothetical protein
LRHSLGQFEAPVLRDLSHELYPEELFVEGISSGGMFFRLSELQAISLHRN